MITEYSAGINNYFFVIHYMPLIDVYMNSLVKYYTTDAQTTIKILGHSLVRAWYILSELKLAVIGHLKPIANSFI